MTSFSNNLAHSPSNNLANGSSKNVAQRLVVLLLSACLCPGAVVIPMLSSQAATTPEPLPVDQPLRISQYRPRPRYQLRYRPRSRYRYPSRLRRPIRRPPARRLPPRRSSRLPWKGRRLRPSTYRWGGLARGNSCVAQQQPIATALVPPQNSGQTSNLKPTPDRAGFQKKNLNFDTTLSTHPIFWLYISDLPETVLDFTLQDEAGKTQLYSAEFAVEAGSGIIGITLPESVPSLEVGKDKAYVWQVRIECDEEDPSKDLYLGSGVRRLSLDDLQQSEDLNAQAWASNRDQANERELPSLYANIGIWQDALSQLATLRFVAPDDLEVQEEWELLLQEAGFQEPELQNFKTAPVLQMF